MIALVLAVLVDIEALLEASAAAFVAGIGLVFVFSLAVLGAARFADYARDRRVAAAVLSGLLALLGLAATATAIVLGIIAMAS
ncbi:MAG TPA: hypothetical protein VK919_14675 [Solirubrobacterales bacterium]|nr:hypothetical protein [Solirubrobacterales bacterium]